MKTVILPLALLAAVVLGRVPVATAADAASGRALYERYCARCHGPTPVQFQSGANITTADAQLIRNTIAGNPVMSFLRFLTDPQIDDIVAYLNLQLGVAGPFNYTDAWWNAGESGWGITIVHRAATNQIFAILNHYDDARRPFWYALPGGRWTGQTFSGAIYATSGSALGGPYAASELAVRPAGTASITFHNHESATLAYEIDGRRVEKSITRLPF